MSCRHGTYANLKLDDLSKKRIASLIEQLKLENGVEPDALCTTVIYCNRDCPDLQEMHDTTVGAIGRVIDLKKHPAQDGTQCLVAIVECPLANSLYDYMRVKTDSPHDYDQYVPYITLGYNCGDNDYTLPAEHYPVRYSKLHVTPL